MTVIWEKMHFPLNILEKAGKLYGSVILCETALQYVCFWVCVFFTIKNLQHVKLSLSLETFKGNGDIVSFFYCDAPWTHLEVRVALWPPGAQDDTWRVVSHIMRRALDYREKIKGEKNGDVTWVYALFLSFCQHKLFEIWIRNTCAVVLTHTHLGMLEVVHPSVVFLRGDMLESHCQLMRIPDGICTWWCRLNAQNGCELWVFRKQRWGREKETSLLISPTVYSQWWHVHTFTHVLYFGTNLRYLHLIWVFLFHIT